MSKPYDFEADPPTPKQRAVRGLPGIEPGTVGLEVRCIMSR